MAIPTLDVEQYQYEDDGFLINGPAVVPFLDLTRVQGLDSSEFRTSSHDREGTDGGYMDAEFEKLRTVILEGTLYADTNAFETVVDSLKGNYAPAALPRPLYFQTDAGLRAIWGKSLGFKYDKEQMRRRGCAAFQIQIACEDPRIYTPNQITASVTLGTTVVTGRGYPKSYPYGYGPAATTAKAILVLGGNRPQPGIIRVDGPINNPKITHEESGVIATVNVNVANGDFILIDLNTRSVRTSSGTNIRGKLTLTGNWYMLQVGNNTFSFDGSATLEGTTKLSITAYEAAWR